MCGSVSPSPWHHLFLQHSLWSTAVGRHQTPCWSLLWCSCRDTPLLLPVAPGWPELQVPSAEVLAPGSAGSGAAVPAGERALPRRLQPHPPTAAPDPGHPSVGTAGSALAPVMVGSVWLTHTPLSPVSPTTKVGGGGTFLQQRPMAQLSHLPSSSRAAKPDTHSPPPPAPLGVSLSPSLLLSLLQAAFCLETPGPSAWLCHCPTSSLARCYRGAPQIIWCLH